ncbi:hypothetical protein [Thioalkalivibrio sp. HK1]|uniref:hypothetical protein n=1 Tax=Thioalkalivibrio sp. HK1 TaxID=1469245 RepID=UPI000470480B|nr:hypothetical protein [Thioalkalivibrio sp. HK1]
MPIEPTRQTDPRSSTAPRRRFGRGTLLGLFVIFFAPVMLAWSLNVWWPDWHPFGETNHGELIRPPWRVEDPAIGEAIAGSWALLHIADRQCSQDCMAMLDTTRRVHISLGKDFDRVVRGYIRPHDAPEGAPTPHVDMIDLPLPFAWVERFKEDRRPFLLIIDPQGYAVLRYGIDFSGKGLASDIARLLRISKIG